MQKQPVYCQLWKNYGGAVGHMLRFYLKHPDATVAEMSRASLMAWAACDRAFRRLDQTESDAVRAYFTQPREAGVTYVQSESERLVIDKIMRLVAIEAGLADP